jgi:hypothetical protein
MAVPKPTSIETAAASPAGPNVSRTGATSKTCRGAVSGGAFSDAPPLISP